MTPFSSQSCFYKRLIEGATRYLAELETARNTGQLGGLSANCYDEAIARKRRDLERYRSRLEGLEME